MSSRVRYFWIRHQHDYRTTVAVGVLIVSTAATVSSFCQLLYNFLMIVTVSLTFNQAAFSFRSLLL